MSRKIVALVGTYRASGVINQAVAEVLRAAEEEGATAVTIQLLDRHIEFCRNCRTCTQAPGPGRGRCVQQDDLEAILAEVDAADALVIASPVNFFNVTAVTRKFLERLVGYAYWPWGKLGPAYRIKHPAKKAVLITSSAMPASLGRFATGAMRALKLICRTVGARPIGSLFLGLAAQKEQPRLTAAQTRRAHRLGVALAA